MTFYLVRLLHGLPVNARDMGTEEHETYVS